MKLDRTEIAVIAIFVLAIVTANAWYRVKVGGMRARMRLEQQRALLDAGPADAGHD